MYQIDTCLGKGTYGKVYKANHTLTNNKVAFKRLLIDTSTKANYVLNIKEMDMMARLAHPHIVPLTDVVFDPPPLSPIKKSTMKDDKIFYVMPCAEIPVHKYLQLKPSIKSRKNLLWQLIAGLQHIHRNDIIHRDLKPQNLLLFNENGKEILKIADLGLAVPYIYCEPRTPQMITIWYRPPEMLTDMDYDMKADIWSTACIFYEIITGNPIFSKYGEKEMLTDIDNFFAGKSERKSSVLISKLNHLEKLFHNELELTSIQIEEFNSSPGTYRQFLDLLTHMFAYNSIRRYNCDDIIRHPFFDGYREELSQVITPLPHSHKLFFHSKRGEGIKIITFQKKAEFRVKFLAVDILDRILEYEKNKELETETIRQYAVCAIYIAEKYLRGEEACAFKELLVGYESDYRDYKNTEIKVIRDILQYKIYRKTLYDLIDAEGEELALANYMNALYHLTTNITNLTGITLRDLYAVFKYVVIHYNNKWKDKLLISLN